MPYSSPIPEFIEFQKNNSENLQAELEKLSSSFRQLKETTEQVTLEANATAVYLKDKLHDTTFRFFSVIDSVDDLILIKDAQGRWRTLNQFGQKLYRLGPKDYTGKTDLELAEKFPHHAKGLTYCNFTDQKTWKSRSSYREIESFEIDGLMHHFDIIKTPIFYPNGNPKELIILGRDVTELIEAQNRTKACSGALNSASDNILIMDSFGMMSFCNDALLHTFGFHDHTEIEGKHFSLLFSEKTDEKLQTEMWNCIKSNNPFNGILSFRHVRDYSFTAQLHIIPVMNGQPEPVYHICVLKICLE